MFKLGLIMPLLILTACQVKKGGGGEGGGGGIITGQALSISLSATSNHLADGIDASQVTVTVLSGGSPAAGIVPILAVTGSNNIISACTSTDAAGIATCGLRSTKAETKVLEVSSPARSNQVAVTFNGGAPAALHSRILPTAGALANGVSSAPIQITLKDINGNPVAGVVPTFDATDSGNNNVYGACSATNASGISSCSMRSQTSEFKTLRITSPLVLAGSQVHFYPGPAVAANSTITGTSPVFADGTSASTIQVNLRDSNQNGVFGIVPTFSATGTGNTYGTCGMTDITGSTTCQLRSTGAGTKTLSLTTPVTKTGGTVTFIDSVLPDPAFSTITATGPVIANGVATSTVTITLRNSSNAGMAGIVPEFAATDTDATNSYGVCSATDASGVSTCTLTSLRAETKLLGITQPILKADGMVTFIPGPPSAVASTITGTSPVAADGVATSTITVTIRDAHSNPIAGETPAFEATNSGGTNVYGACSVTSASGQSTCTLSSTRAESKVLSLTAPVVVLGDTVIFTAGVPIAANSSITGTGPTFADGISASTVTILLRDSFNNPVPGILPTFGATDTGANNVYGACSTTNSSGVATCSLRSLTAETKTLSILTPVSKDDGTVVFVPGAAVAANSSITGTSPVTANGVAVSTVTITLRDAANNPVVGEVPTFAATDSGAGNVYGTCAATNASGVSVCTLSSTVAEVKTLSITAPVSKIGDAVTFLPGAPVAANSTITGTGPVPADGGATSTITITLRDAFSNPVPGEAVAFVATDSGSGNTYGSCSTTDASGAATCTLSSTVAETKTLSISTPVSKSDGTVVFTSGAPVAANSSITGSSPVTADGVATSSITVTLRDANNNPVSGEVPLFSASGTGNSFGTCSSTDSSGVSTCSLSSTVAEAKTLSITSPVSKADGVVTFVAGPAVAANSSITGTSPVPADGTTPSTVTITLRDAFNNPVAGEVPSFTATDTDGGNSYGTCSATDASGMATCDLRSTKAETKTLSITAPVSKSDGTVVFTAGAAVAANSSITGTGPVVANGTATSTVTITLRDAANNPVVGETPTFAATDTGSTNTYGACSATDASGVSTCTLRSTRAETKTLSITAPVSKADGTVVFTAGPAVAANSNVTGTGPVVADGVASSVVTVALRDAHNNPVSGITPTFSSSGTNNTIVACGASDASGNATCGLRSTRAQVKTLSIATPFVKTGGTVTFIAGAVAASTSTITGTSPVSADGVSTSFISITLLDAFSNPVSGVTPIFNATDTDSLNTYGACLASNASGLSTCTLASSRAEVKTLQLTSPVAVTGGTVHFSASLPTAANSTITGTGPVLADGVATSTVTITLRDSSNNAVAGLVPTFDATDTDGMNDYDDCSMSNASGVSVCTFTSTRAETKTLRITSPVTKSGGTVVFTPGAIVAANSSIAGTGPVVADGVATSTITITLRDAFNNPVSGSTPTFSATNTGNTNVQTTCTAGNAAGVSTCTLASTRAESKTPQLLTPVSRSGAAILFIGGTPVAANSTITGTGPVNPDGVSTSTITITLRDVYNNTVPGVTPTFSATGTNNTYGSCSSTNASGVSTCTLASTTQETKTLSIATPVVKSDGTVVFMTGAPVAANSTISATGPVVANGVATSTVTITLRDAVNSPVLGVTPTFTATGTNNTYNTCSASDASGISTCTFSSTRAEAKTVSIATPFIKAGNSVTFVAGTASALGSTIEGTGPHKADGIDSCDITVVIADAFSNPISGVTPVVASTGTANTISACTVTDASGTSTCQLTSTKAEGKTLSITSPVSKTGNMVDFNPEGINLQVPIEMVDRGIASSTSTTAWLRSSTYFDPADFESESNVYRFEIIADNINTTTAYTVSLIDQSNVILSDSVITVPANTTSPTRFSVEFSPNETASTYRIRTAVTASASQLKVHTARIIVEQTKAVSTRVYYPMLSGDWTGESNSATAQVTSSTSTTYVTPAASNFIYYSRNDALYDAIAVGDSWRLEALLRTNNNLGEAAAALFNRTTGQQVTAATLTHTGNTTVTPRMVNFPSNATNFVDGNVYEVRIKSNSTSYTTGIFRAVLSVKLKYLKRAQVPFRLATRRSAGSSATTGDGRFFYDRHAWSNPTASFMALGNVNTQTIQLWDAGLADDGLTGTLVTGASLTPTATYGPVTSGAISLTDGNRYIIRQNRTSGTVVVGTALVLINASE